MKRIRLVKISSDDAAVLIQNAGPDRAYIGKKGVTKKNGFVVSPTGCVTFYNRKNRRHPRGDLTDKVFFACGEPGTALAVLEFKRGRRGISREYWTRRVDL